MKICSLYGAGFYYIPGTDTCLKIGGFARSETNINSGGSFGPIFGDNETRATQFIQNRVRMILTADARSQTAYGTLRSYFRAGWQWTTNDFQQGGSQGSAQLTATNAAFGAARGSSSTTYLDRVFIQLGGWTFGKTQSFYDFFPTGNYSLQTPWLWNDTGGRGSPVIAYTFALGNGITATLSAEDSSEQRLPIVGVGGTTAGTIATTALSVANNNLQVLTSGGSSATSVNSTAGNLVPDLIANIRIDQAWGSAQASVAGHLSRAAYYVVGAQPNGYPSDKWGFAGQIGVTFNLPMLAKGDTASIQTAYCNGATAFCANQPGGQLGAGNFVNFRSGVTQGVAYLEEAYYDAPGNGGLELPKVWNVVGGFNHYWMPNLQTSLYGAYLKYQANSNAVNTVGATSCATLGLGAGCRDFAMWTIGSRTLWNPVVNLDVGVDVLYWRLKSAYNGLAVAAGAAGSGVGAATVGDVGTWAGIVRFQRNFWP